MKTFLQWVKKSLLKYGFPALIVVTFIYMNGLAFVIGPSLISSDSTFLVLLGVIVMIADIAISIRLIRDLINFIREEL